VIRPARGVVVIAKAAEEAGRELVRASGIVLPATVDRSELYPAHVGRVIAMGPPARTRLRWDWSQEDWVGDVEVPPAFAVGDTVVYVWALRGTEAARTYDGFDEYEGHVAFVAQEEVIAIIDAEPADAAEAAP
jgi:hypothetical protein